MNLKNRPSQAKEISKSISKMTQKLGKGKVKEGVDLVKLVKTVARRKMENVKAEAESKEETGESEV